MTFQEQILEGIPSILPQPKVYEPAINHAPKRKDILTVEEKNIDIIEVKCLVMNWRMRVGYNGKVLNH